MSDVNNAIRVDKTDIRLSTKEGKVKGFTKAVLKTDIGEVTIFGLRIADGRDGLFVGMPSEKSSNGDFYDRVRLSDSLQKDLESAVLAAYHAKVEEGK